MYSLYRLCCKNSFISFISNSSSVRKSVLATPSRACRGVAERQRACAIARVKIGRRMAPCARGRGRPVECEPAPLRSSLGLRSVPNCGLFVSHSSPPLSFKLKLNSSRCFDRRALHRRAARIVCLSCRRRESWAGAAPAVGHLGSRKALT